MKAIVDASEFRGLCELAKMATDREWPNVIFQVAPPSGVGKPPRLAAAGFGGHRSVMGTISCDADHIAGSAVVNATAAEKLAKSLPGGRATIELKSSVMLTCGSRAFALDVAAKDFPIIPTPTDEPAKLPAQPLRQVMRATAFAMSGAADDAKSPKSCMLLRWGNGIISAFACDGHRSAFAMSADEDVPEATGSLMVPHPVIRIVDAIADDAEFVSVWASTDRAFFGSGSTRTHVQLTGAVFPPGIILIPPPSDRPIMISRAILLDELAAILAVDPEKGCAIEISTGNVSLSTRATSAAGRCSVATSFNGPTMKHWINPTYLREAVAVVDADEVSIQWMPRTEQPEYADAVIRADPDDGSYHVLCPITPPAAGR